MNKMTKEAINKREELIKEIPMMSIWLEDKDKLSFINAMCQWLVAEPIKTL